ncbi:MAG TPA: peptidoglycan DD-metalloendopeptidase family protein [Smithella sp.]|nr:peptidoglycan DD-metalloendopeptidase family protein [Smithella sp.]
MSDNLFTLMIIPNRKSGVKKITIPKVFVRNVLIVAIIAVVASLYVIYDYASIKRDRAELARLKAQIKEQSQQFEELAMKIDSFSDRMEELRKVDKKIRMLAYETSPDKKLPLGVGGSDRETRIKDLLNKDQTTVVAAMRDNIAKLNDDANLREKSFTELIAFLNEQKSFLASTPSLWPVEGWVTSEFGFRKSPFGAGTEFHKGLDISTRFGKEIVAPADGLVVKSGFKQQDGNYLRMEHGHGFETAYLHLSRIVAKQGMRVKRGEIIGYVGDTGRSTGPHLHYAVSVNGVAVDPERFLR